MNEWTTVNKYGSLGECFSALTQPVLRLHTYALLHWIKMVALPFIYLLLYLDSRVCSTYFLEHQPGLLLN